MVFVVTAEKLIESAFPAHKKARQKSKRAFSSSVVAKYKARLIELQEQARHKVPIADEETLNIRFNS